MTDNRDPSFRNSLLKNLQMYESTMTDDFLMEDVLFNGILRQKTGTELFDKSGTCQHFKKSLINSPVEDQLQTALKLK